MKKIIISILLVISLSLIGIICYITYPKTIKVEIKGEVLNPNVYVLKKGSTIKELIDVAGGVKEDVDTYTINMTKVLDDGDVVVMYKDEKLEGLNYKVNEIVNDKSTDEYITNEIWESSKISINSATKEELMSLPSIGEAKASAIIEYRTKNGLFKKLEDIKNVKGIGNALYEKIKDYINI